MLELKGSEKQIKWAEEIRQDMLKALEEKQNLNNHADYIEEGSKKAGQWEKVEKAVGDFRTVFKKVEELVNSEDSAKWFIENRNTDGRVENLRDMITRMEDDEEVIKNAIKIIKNYNQHRMADAYNRSNK